MTETHACAGKPVMQCLLSLRILCTGYEFSGDRFVSLLNDFLTLCTDSAAPSVEPLQNLLNRLADVCRDISFSAHFDQFIFDRLLALTGQPIPIKTESLSADALFHYEHAVFLCEQLRTLIPEIATRTGNELSREYPESLPFLRPSVAALNTNYSLFLRMKLPAVLVELNRRSKSEDVFANARIFRHQNGKFTPIELPDIRKVEDFYGYQLARHTFEDHFAAFSEGRGNFPFLISSLPGLGKTQMTIAYALHYPNITLIIPDPEDISHGLEDLVALLKPHTDRKFMLFFDDIDVDRTDWYYFRTHIGGTFSLPPNIAVTVASNQAFPANISSRGRGFTFPMFDEIRCSEMILDFLIAKGMKEPKNELISVIAADYVSEFGQKKFEELSPRTLVRYLGVFLTDIEKRRLLLETSRGDVIPQPDPQIFYEENVKLMCAIHGPEAMEQFRKEALHV